jgi:mRNA interferase HigB
VKGERGVRIISKKKLRDFWQRYPDARKPLQEWYDLTAQANWRTFAQIRNTFRHADAYCDCVIFNVKGNDYRLIAIVLYQVQRVYVRQVLTHKEYDKGAWKDDCSC